MLLSHAPLSWLYFTNSTGKRRLQKLINLNKAKQVKAKERIDLTINYLGSNNPWRGNSDSSKIGRLTS